MLFLRLSQTLYMCEHYSKDIICVDISLIFIDYLFFYRFLIFYCWLGRLLRIINHFRSVFILTSLVYVIKNIIFIRCYCLFDFFGIFWIFCNIFLLYFYFGILLFVNNFLFFFFLGTFLLFLFNLLFIPKYPCHIDWQILVVWKVEEDIVVSKKETDCAEKSFNEKKTQRIVQ